jgi:release factor glutamine methyltransferase
VNVGEALRNAARRLEATSDTARLDAEVLMAHALGVSRSRLLTSHMRDPAPRSFVVLVSRRQAQEPVAYITGEQEFYGLSFKVTPAVLIPRADSETLVDAALRARPDARHVLDCGTGSGALLLATLAHLPQATGVGVERSQGALAIAEENAARTGLRERARLLPADWTDPGWVLYLGRRFDLILANPPYVEDDARLPPSVRDYEPHGALFAGPAGLDAYRALIPQLPVLLAPGGVALFEIGHTQAEAVTTVANEAGFTARLHRDLGCRPRVLELSRTPSPRP